MIIKTSQKPNLFPKVLNSFFARFRRLRPMGKIVVCMVLLVAVFISGMYFARQLHRSGQPESFLGAWKLISQSKIRIIPNYFKGLTAKPEKIVIDIKHKDFQKLAYKKEVALDKGILITSADDYVPAKIRYARKTYKVKLRLKGDMLEHLGPEKWSFRVKVRGDNTIMQMKQFSLHHPKARNYIHEWIYHQALKNEELLSLRYKFVNVIVNGKNWGIYALEEHFEKRLVESNRLRQGPVLKFSEELLWADIGKFLPITGWDNHHSLGLRSMYSSQIDVFKKNNTFTDPQLYQQFLAGKNLLEAFRNGTLPTSRVFDVKKLARFFAISDLMGAWHSSGIWNNLRFYYNPVTSLLEPIGFDGYPGQNIQREKLMCMIGRKNSNNPSYFHIQAFKDQRFYEEYLKALERISEESYLRDLFARLQAELEQNLKIIYKEYPYFHFSKACYYHNRQMIKNTLNPAKGLHAYLHQKDYDGITLQLGNIQSLPVEILGLSYKNDQFYTPIAETILTGTEPSIPVAYKDVKFSWPESFGQSEIAITDLRVHYRVLATAKVRTESIMQWPYFDENFAKNDFIRQSPNHKEFSFLDVDEPNRIITLKTGNINLAQNLIIPKGYTITCRPGTKLNLTNSAKILSYSPLVFVGSEENPVIIHSDDATGQGIVIIGTAQKSIFNHVKFENLSSPAQNGWQLTGALTFYEAPVDISHCQFINNRAEDSLNIIRSEFTIDHCLFDKSFSDAFDGDFCSGSITNSSFIDSGNDAIDISGSDVKLQRIFVNRAGDKGLSAGENSRLRASEIVIKNTEIAVSSKDMSEITINNIDIANCKIGFAPYQKKPEFGPATIFVKNLKISEIVMPYLIEYHSKMVVDEKQIAPNQKDVKNVLYGAQYGKSTKSISL